MCKRVQSFYFISLSIFLRTSLSKIAVNLISPLIRIHTVNFPISVKVQLLSITPGHKLISRDLLQQGLPDEGAVHPDVEALDGRDAVAVHLAHLGLALLVCDEKLLGVLSGGQAGLDLVKLPQEDRVL